MSTEWKIGLGVAFVALVAIVIYLVSRPSGAAYAGVAGTTATGTTGGDQARAVGGAGVSFLGSIVDAATTHTSAS
jgi:hypothetical protein